MILCDMDPDPPRYSAFEKIEIGRAFGKVRDVDDFMFVDRRNSVECPRERGRKVFVDLNLQAAARSSNAIALRTAAVGIS